MSDSGQFTEDAFCGGQLRLRQPKSGHRAGHDAMLLAASTPARSGDRVVDFGAGVGAASLALARRVAGIELVLVEIDPGLAALARDNAAANALEADVVVLDVTSNASAFAAAGLTPDSADVVLMNPPFNDSERHRASPDKAREIAHMATDPDRGVKCDSSRPDGEAPKSSPHTYASCDPKETSRKKIDRPADSRTHTISK